MWSWEKLVIKHSFHLAITSSTPAVIVVPGVAPATSLTVATGSVCPDNACKNGGTCVKSYSGFSCNCPPGFHGMDCSSMSFFFLSLL